jgi:hypothetical protein
VGGQKREKTRLRTQTFDALYIRVKKPNKLNDNSRITSNKLRNGRRIEMIIY